MTWGSRIASIGAVNDVIVPDYTIDQVQIQAPIKNGSGCTDCGTKQIEIADPVEGSIAPVMSTQPEYYDNTAEEIERAKTAHAWGSYVPLVLLLIIAYWFNKD